MSKVIEVVVVGPVGSGKSHVLAVIDAALREAYGPHTQVVSRELSLERGLGGPTTKPPVDTIFDLKERGPVSDPIVTKLKVEVDTSDIDVALGKAETLQASTAGFAIDPLESAIESATRLMRDELEASGTTPGQFPIGAYARLDAHLDELLRMQIDKLKG